MTVLIVPMIYSLKPNAIEDCRRDSGGRAEWKDAVSKNPESTFIRSAGVSKQPSDFKRIDNAIMKCLATAFAIAIVLAFGVQATCAQTLKVVQDRGQLICGANGVLAGFGMPDPQGNWIGFDVDYCRAMAAAISTIRRKLSLCR